MSGGFFLNWKDCKHWFGTYCCCQEAKAQTDQTAAAAAATTEHRAHSTLLQVGWILTCDHTLSAWRCSLTLRQQLVVCVWSLVPLSHPGRGNKNHYRGYWGEHYCSSLIAEKHGRWCVGMFKCKRIVFYYYLCSLWSTNENQEMAEVLPLLCQ